MKEADSLVFFQEQNELIEDLKQVEKFGINADLKTFESVEELITFLEIRTIIFNPFKENNQVTKNDTEFVNNILDRTKYTNDTNENT